MAGPEIGEDGSIAMSDQQKLAWKIGGAVIAVLFVMGAVSCATEQPADPRPARIAKTPLERATEKLDPDAIVLMDRANYPRAYGRLGRVRFDEANDLTRWAALGAAESDQCPKVDTIGLDEQRATRAAIVWYVDCSNRERFVISEEQARATRDRLDPDASPEARQRAETLAIAEPRSARWKDFNEGSAVTTCRNLVRSTMLNQRAFDAAWRWDSERDDDTGIVTIQQDFEGQNGFGGTISSRYHCVVDTNDGIRVRALRIREVDGWRNLI